jgi:hypothetical protein
VNLDEIESFLKSDDVESEQKRLRIVRAIGMYSVGLFAVKASYQGDVLDLAGSGTLVQIGETHYILTARHVWQDVLKVSNKLGVTLREIVDHCHLIDISTIVPIGPAQRPPWTEQGPDIVLLRIPDAYVGAIRAFKVFYNLSIDEPPPLPGDSLRTWFLMGVPGATGTFSQNHASVEHIGAEVGFLNSQIDEPWDLCDVNFNASFLPPPKSVGGMSGGGLWKVFLYDAPTSDGFDCVVVLAGVAFWQFALDGKNRKVRCHGIESLKKLKSLVEDYENVSGVRRSGTVLVNESATVD